jgi:hypothetical protein
MKCPKEYHLLWQTMQGLDCPDSILERRELNQIL